MILPPVLNTHPTRTNVAGIENIHTASFQADWYVADFSFHYSNGQLHKSSSLSIDIPFSYWNAATLLIIFCSVMSPLEMTESASSLLLGGEIDIEHQFHFAPYWASPAGWTTVLWKFFHRWWFIATRIGGIGLFVWPCILQQFTFDVSPKLLLILAW